MGSPYYRDMDEPTSPAGGGHHRSRSASRPPISHGMDYPRTCAHTCPFKRSRSHTNTHASLRASLDSIALSNPRFPSISPPIRSTTQTTHTHSHTHIRTYRRHPLPVTGPWRSRRRTRPRVHSHSGAARPFARPIAGARPLLGGRTVRPVGPAKSKSDEYAIRRRSRLPRRAAPPELRSTAWTGQSEARTGSDQSEAGQFDAQHQDVLVAGAEEGAGAAQGGERQI